MARNIFRKTLFSIAAFSAGIVFGLAAEANASGLPLLSLFQG